MTYQLLDDARGVAVGQDAVYLTGRDSPRLSFLLPENRRTAGCTLFAVLTDSRGQRYERPISDGGCDLPQPLLRPQIVSVSVVSLRNGQPVFQWVCTPLQICRVGEACKNAYMLWPDAAGIPDRVSALEIAAADREARLQRAERQIGMLADLAEKLTRILEKQNEKGDLI